MTKNPVIEDRHQRKIHAQRALDKLKKFSEDKLTLQRPVVFVPGWTDESCDCWMKGNRRYQPLKDWFNTVFTNPDQAHYIKFTEESKNCRNFLDFGKVLKKKVWDKIGKESPFDFVGHSMGGLNIRAAITQGEPMLNCGKCITVATPHHGDHFGGILWFSTKTFFRRILQIFKPMDTYQFEQGKYLDPDYPAIKVIDSLENRKLFLERIKMLYQLKGTRDFLVKGSAFIDENGLDETHKEKIHDVPVEGCDHTGRIGITQDPRTVLAIIYLLSDISLPEDKKNYGILQGGIYTPSENEERFV